MFVLNLSFMCAFVTTWYDSCILSELIRKMKNRKHVAESLTKINAPISREILHGIGQ